MNLRINYNLIINNHNVNDTAKGVIKISAYRKAHDGASASAASKKKATAITRAEEIRQLTDKVRSHSIVKEELFEKFDVKRGLRDKNGVGVLTGLTNISEVRSKEIVNGEAQHVAGKLFYRGIDVEDLVNGCKADNRLGFEETVYLLLFGELPDSAQLKSFCEMLAEYRTLPSSFVRDIIMKAPSRDMMNTLARSVLTMYSYDPDPDNTSLENVLRQCLQLIAIFPLLSVYGYCAFSHYYNAGSLVIHSPQKNLSTSENILHLLRPDSSFTELEAKVLDTALILHAEHGGGNNSSFTTRVVTSSGTDTYSTISAALSSLKGPRHGGANIKVVRMFEDMKKSVKDWTDDDEIAAYLNRILEKQAFDNQGLIYGIGHAIYSVSDPRAVMFKSFVKKLSAEKGLDREYALYEAVERIAPEVVAAKRKMYKGISANVDFYSGFAYQMLGLPTELYTPIFAVARIAGWSAHRLEELANNGKIIRPAYKEVCERRKYVPLSDRT